VGRKPSDDYDYGEPGKWGEPYEMIDEVEGDDDDDWSRHRLGGRGPRRGRQRWRRIRRTRSGL